MYSASQMQCLATQVADTVSSFCSLFHSLSTIEEESTKYIYSNSCMKFALVPTATMGKTYFMYCPVRKQNWQNLYSNLIWCTVQYKSRINKICTQTAALKLALLPTTIMKRTYFMYCPYRRRIDKTCTQQLHATCLGTNHNKKKRHYLWAGRVLQQCQPPGWRRRHTRQRSQND